MCWGGLVASAGAELGSDFSYFLELDSDNYIGCGFLLEIFFSSQNAKFWMI